MVVTTNTAFPKFATIYADTPLDTLKAWQAFKVADSAAPCCPSASSTPASSSATRPWPASPSRRPAGSAASRRSTASWARRSASVYVARYFPPRIKAKMDRPGRQHPHGRAEGAIWTAWTGCRRRPRPRPRTSWPSFTVKIGYPDKWRDYSRLEIKPDDLYGNALRSAAFEWRLRRRRA